MADFPQMEAAMRYFAYAVDLPALLAQFTRSTALQTKTLRLGLRSFWRHILLLSFGMVLAGSPDWYAGSRTMSRPSNPS
ncbi:hypothetical protein, partial [Bradyrhizobium ottawaense]|uniref:hypothetical protein n=1 Tax=Bradyrhizobium ottawaense TaxID=931866 RepID=UPI0030C728D8